MHEPVSDASDWKSASLGVGFRGGVRIVEPPLRGKVHDLPHYFSGQVAQPD